MTNETSDLNRAISAIEGLSRADLVKLQDVIETLLIEGYLDTDPTGYVEYKFITRPNGKQYGPYRYRRVWINGKLTSRYEGKADPGEYEVWLKNRASVPQGTPRTI
jgi:hypothetical protein